MRARGAIGGDINSNSCSTCPLEPSTPQAEMVSLSIALALLPLALANTYVTPFADGSDGWQDAFDKAKGTYLL